MFAAGGVEGAVVAGIFGVVWSSSNSGVVGACVLDASAYPVVRPSVAVVAKPVARIFAEFATPGRRVFLTTPGLLLGGGGGGGSSGSLIISRHPRHGRRHGHRRDGVRHDGRRHHVRHHRRHGVHAVGPLMWASQTPRP